MKEIPAGTQPPTDEERRTHFLNRCGIDSAMMAAMTLVRKWNFALEGDWTALNRKLEGCTPMRVDCYRGLRNKRGQSAKAAASGSSSIRQHSTDSRPRNKDPNILVLEHQGILQRCTPASMA